VADQGTFDYAVWRLGFADLLAGRLPEARPIARASTPIQVEISPDGGRLRWIRDLPAGGGGAEVQIVVTPYGDTTGTRIPVTGSLLGAYWLDSVTLEVGTRRTGNRLHLARVDVRTGVETRPLELPPDSNVVDFSGVADGWSWIPATGDRIVVRQNDSTRTFPKPRWVWTLGQMISDRRGRLISYLGRGSEREDSLSVGVISLDDGSNTRWATVFAENAGTAFLPDGSLLMIVFETQQTVTIYRLRGPGQSERLGTIPRQVSDVSVSGDLKRALLTVQDYHADAWMTPVTRR
jgi:dipeptidyl aminopeptidase/acylaminoacyl peptidase